MPIRSAPSCPTVTDLRSEVVVRQSADLDQICGRGPHVSRFVHVNVVEARTVPAVLSFEGRLLNTWAHRRMQRSEQIPDSAAIFLSAPRRLAVDAIGPWLSTCTRVFRSATIPAPWPRVDLCLAHRQRFWRASTALETAPDSDPSGGLQLGTDAAHVHGCACREYLKQRICVASNR